MKKKYNSISLCLEVEISEKGYIVTKEDYRGIETYYVKNNKELTYLILHMIVDKEKTIEIFKALDIKHCINI